VLLDWWRHIVTINPPIAPPPNKRNPQPPKKTTPVENPDQTKQEREDALNGLWTAATAFCMMGGQWADAGAISIHGPGISREAAALSLKYEKIGNALDALANVSPFANLLGATLPLIFQIAANHKMIPAHGIPGIKDPGVLESQMRVEQQRMAMEYAKMAAQEKADLEAELAKMNASAE
jgi:hypothetical protein